MSITTRKFTPPAPIQAEMGFAHDRNRAVLIKREDTGNNPCAFYEGDLGITLHLTEGIEFNNLPINECYMALFDAFVAAGNIALSKSDPVEAAESLCAARTRFCDLALKVHEHASRIVCTDWSRKTTATGLLNNFIFTLTKVTAACIDPMAAGNEPLQIEPGQCGLLKWDGAGISVAYVWDESFSRLQRTDPSRGLSYSTANEGAKRAPKLDMLAELISTGSTGKKLHPSAYLPLADAFRGELRSVTQQATIAARQFRANVLEAAQESEELKE